MGTLFQVILCHNRYKILSHLEWPLETDNWYSPIALLNIWKITVMFVHFIPVTFPCFFLILTTPLQRRNIRTGTAVLHDGIHKWHWKLLLCTLSHFTHHRCSNSSNPVIMPYARTTLTFRGLFKKFCFIFSYVYLHTLNSCFKISFRHHAVLPIIQWS